MKNVASKTRPASNPYASWTDARSRWQYKLLKSWQADNSKPYARWHVDVVGFGHDMGDEYASHLLPGISSFDLTFDTTIWPDYETFFKWARGEK